MKKTYGIVGSVEEGFEISFTTDNGGNWQTVLSLESLDESEAICTVLNAFSDNEKYTQLIIAMAKKSRKWDLLDADIAKFYPDDDDQESDGDLSSIGEIAAIRLGYL